MAYRLHGKGCFVLMTAIFNTIFLIVFALGNEKPGTTRPSKGNMGLEDGNRHLSKSETIMSRRFEILFLRPSWGECVLFIPLPPVPKT